MKQVVVLTASESLRQNGGSVEICRGILLDLRGWRISCLIVRSPANTFRIACHFIDSYTLLYSHTQPLVKLST